MRTGREAAVPESVQAALEQVLGTRVGHVKVIEHSWFARLHARAVATTRPRRIYLRDDAAGFYANPWLMLHEYCHVLHQWQPGRLTVPRYVVECLQRGYWNNRFEVEAREFADRNVARLHAMLTLLAPPTPPSPAQRPASPEQRLASVETARQGDEQSAKRER